MSHHSCLLIYLIYLIHFELILDPYPVVPGKEPPESHAGLLGLQNHKIINELWQANLTNATRATNTNLPFLITEIPRV